MLNSIISIIYFNQFWINPKIIECCVFIRWQRIAFRNKPNLNARWICALRAKHAVNVTRIARKLTVLSFQLKSSHALKPHIVNGRVINYNQFTRYTVYMCIVDYTNRMGINNLGAFYFMNEVKYPNPTFIVSIIYRLHTTAHILSITIILSYSLKSWILNPLQIKSIKCKTITYIL